MKGVVAAGHPLTAEAGAQILRAGGNAVDAALAAMVASFVTEPQLTGLGAGGYMLVAEPGEAPALLDFFVAAPGNGADPAARAPLVPAEVFFEAAAQVFHVGAASCGVYGTPAGICEAHRRFATFPLPDLVAPGVALARAGVELNAQQAYIFALLEPITGSSPEARAKYWSHPPGDRVLREGDVFADPELADTLERLGAEGAAPFYTGDVARAACERVAAGGGMLTEADLAGYEVIARDPIQVGYRGFDVFTNPPPSAGGILIASVLAQLDREPAPPSRGRLVAAMEEAHQARTPEFMEGLDRPGFLEEFMASQLGSTTHISVLDADGRACALTCTNGEGSGIIVPGTGLHLNNMMGEEDLSPLGFFTHPVGRRLPSMMAPTVVSRDGAVHVAVGSAGSNRIRSAILQVIIGVIDRGLDLVDAVEAPRVHWEDGVVFLEPGADEDALLADGRKLAPFKDLNVFFGGAQAVRRDPATGELAGAGDPRRGGAVVTAG
ncbi:MAG: gamma-glutamyltransferase [Solirubrobacteraceae bacterium]